MDLAFVGDRLFGRSLRLRVAAWALGRLDEPFFQTEAALGVGYSASAVAEELNRLAELGMVERLPRLAGSSRVYYRCSPDNPLWHVIRSAIEATTDRSEGAPSGSS